MSIFASILSKLGFGSTKAATPPPAATPAAPAPAAPAVAPAAPAAPAAAMAPAAISAVDVVGQLEALAAKSVEKLNWRVSIVDLMKLVGLDSSFSIRKQLATELGCPAEKMGDSAQMNIWLHQTVLQKLAANGGNVPKDLLP
jgi:3-oxoacyl-ACP reductase-like protein